MRSGRFLRVVSVHWDKNEKTLVSYYDGDELFEIAWKDGDVQAGDLFELKSSGDLSSAQLVARVKEGCFSLDSDAMRWRKATTPNGLSRMEILRRRHLIRQAVRGYLDDRGFTEIDAPLLVKGTTPDIAVESFPLGDGYYLNTSTEYPMKRLAVGGLEKIYSLTQNFRKGDTGTYRNPEFTMLEWGRVGSAMPEIETDAEQLTLAAMKKLGLPDTISYQGRLVDMRAPWPRMTVSEAVQKITGVALDTYDAPTCRRAVEAAGIAVREEWAQDRDFLFSVLMDGIQPRLGLDRPVFLTDWPMFQTTSAASHREDAKKVDRSELFIAGIELGNGFVGLANADMQLAFFNYALALRAQTGQPNVDLDHRYIDAMRLGAPYGAGMALGFDRLVALLTDQPGIANVLALGWAEL